MKKLLVLLVLALISCGGGGGGDGKEGVRVQGTVYNPVLINSVSIQASAEIANTVSQFPIIADLKVQNLSTSKPITVLVDFAVEDSRYATAGEWLCFKCWDNNGTGGYPLQECSQTVLHSYDTPITQEQCNGQALIDLTYCDGRFWLDCSNPYWQFGYQEPGDGYHHVIHQYMTILPGETDGFYAGFGDTGLSLGPHEVRVTATNPDTAEIQDQQIFTMTVQ